jgi:glycerol-3-phosphate dehydrogenase (NAD(P)+)
MTATQNKIIVIGSGEWGSALAKTFGAELVAGRAPAQKFAADIIVLAVKSQAVAEVLKRHDFSNAKIVLAAKGFEPATQKLQTEIAAEILPNNEITVLSGPNFASEISAGLPAVASIACANFATAELLANTLSRKNFRLYPTDDVIGVQILGAVKNVIAIACGIAEGNKLGENARAAIITRSVAEIARLVSALGGKPETLLLPAGVGDLFLTCSSEKSRNFRFGEEIAKNGRFIANPEFLCEGYFACEAIKKLADRKKIEMPICNSVFDVIYNNQDVHGQINQLLERPRLKT